MVALTTTIVSTNSCVRREKGSVPHVSWDLPNDISERHLILDHFRPSVRFRKRGQIRMTPSMRCNLMSVRDHPLNHTRPRRRGINSTLSIINPSDKECSLKAVRREFVQ